MKYRQRVYAAITVAVTFFSVGCERNRYEVVERTQKDVPNFQKPGTHTEVDYILVHKGHKIYAACDTTTLDALDPQATCGFRPLRKYECSSGQDGDLWDAELPLSDLKCKDADGHNVYLYVSKTEMILPPPPLLITVLIALQFAAFGWRINREIPLGDQGRRTWFPLPDYLNILSFLAVVFSWGVLPLVGWSSERLARAVLGVGYSLIAFHPFSEMAHYRLFSKSGRSIYIKTPEDDYPWITGQEIVSVSISLAVAAGVAALGFLK